MTNDDIESIKFYAEIGTDFIEDLQMPSQIKQILDIKHSIEIARKLANECNDLKSLRNCIENFEHCQIKQNAKNTVFSDGNPESEIMFIGEAPGAKEDEQGIPFCGRSGELLDKMLKAINLDRNNVYITNTVFWRPPANRPPTTNELTMCLPFLEKHISLIFPKIIVLLGSSACKALIEKAPPISSIRGNFTSYSNRYLKQDIPMTAIFHPAYVLRQPSKKNIVWEDLKMIQAFIKTK